MTAKQLRAIATRLGQAVDCVTVKDTLLFIAPIGHVLRGVTFERSSDPKGFYTWAFFQPLCVPSTVQYFNLGFRFG